MPSLEMPADKATVYSGDAPKSADISADNGCDAQDEVILDPTEHPYVKRPAEDERHQLPEHVVASILEKEWSDRPTAGDGEVPPERRLRLVLNEYDYPTEYVPEALRQRFSELRGWMLLDAAFEAMRAGQLDVASTDEHQTAMTAIARLREQVFLAFFPGTAPLLKERAIQELASIARPPQIAQNGDALPPGPSSSDTASSDAIQAPEGLGERRRQTKKREILTRIMQLLEPMAAEILVAHDASVEATNERGGPMFRVTENAIKDLFTKTRTPSDVMKELAEQCCAFISATPSLERVFERMPDDADIGPIAYVLDFLLSKGVLSVRRVAFTLTCRLGATVKDVKEQFNSKLVAAWRDEYRVELATRRKRATRDMAKVGETDPEKSKELALLDRLERLIAIDAPST